MAADARGGPVPRFLGEEQFARLYVLLRGEPRIHPTERERERRFLEALCWLARSGAQWRLLPAAYGPWDSVYKRFARWDDLGGWARRLAGAADGPELQAVMIDATVVRAHACAAGAPQKTAARRRRGWGARAAGSAPSSMCSSTPSATR